ncbi:MAG: hypothetical protein QOF83_1767 [Solirubrobacteraceae bacterium]|nr:hypothetical protein [Solirubrobacteraceae bacterium]
MSRARAATVAIMGMRILYGAGLVAAPTRLGRRWLGPASATAPTQVPLQGLGTREMVLHTGVIWAALRGTALRPWLAGSIAGDLTDIAATVARRDGLPDGSAAATAAVGGGSAVLTGLLLAAVDR